MVMLHGGGIHPYFPLVDRHALPENIMRCPLRIMFSGRAITKERENKLTGKWRDEDDISDIHSIRVCGTAHYDA